MTVIMITMFAAELHIAVVEIISHHVSSIDGAIIDNVDLSLARSKHKITRER